MSADTVSFGPYLLDRRREQLTRNGAAISIGHRGFVLLNALLAEQGQTVTKSRLMERAWPGVIVEEGNLTVQIAALRKAIGEEFIVTVPRVGYRLAVPTAAETAFVEDALPRLAVLPFASLGGDPEQNYLANGIAEDVAIALSRSSAFAVIARDMTTAHADRNSDVRQVARELDVRYLLEGTVRRAGDRLRITAQLIDGGTENHIWARSFDGGLDDVLSFQDQIASSVAALVTPRIEKAELARSQRERAGSASAYDLYLRALGKIGTYRAGDSLEALELLDRAIALEPTFVPALALAAHGREIRNSWGWPPYRQDDHETALRLARLTLELAGADAVALARAGIVLLQIGGERELSVRTLERAAELNPFSALVIHHAGVCHVLGGDLDRAAYYFERAIRLNLAETADVAMTGLAHVELCRGNLDHALDWAIRAVSADPNFHAAHWMRVAALAHQGRIEEARRALADLRSLLPDVTVRRLLAGNANALPERWLLIAAGLRLAGLPEL